MRLLLRQSKMQYRIRRLTGALFLALVLACVLVVRADHSLNVASLDSQAPVPLRLTLKMLGEQYCIGDAELDGLRLKVRMVYTNQSEETIILYKGSTAISRLMISRNLADVAARRFEV